VDHLGQIVRVGMAIRAIVAGTGFENRDQYIRRFAKAGTPVVLRREPDNKFDMNAIAVDMLVKRWYTLFKEVPIQIGYIKHERAISMSKKLDAGGKILSAYIESMHVERNHPRVSLVIETDW